jgi:acetyltransferase-like isoleucine patch superfamily enzyme
MPDTALFDEVRPATLEGLAALGMVMKSLAALPATLEAELPVRLAGVAMKADCAVGAFTYFGSQCAVRSVRIGRYCSIASRIVIAPSEHPLGWLSTHPFQYDGADSFRKAPEYRRIAGAGTFAGNQCDTVIGNDVWIGEGAFIRKGVTIGDGAVIAAHACVTRSVEPYAVVAGTPARPVRFRHPAPLIERLLRLQWWNYDLSRITRELAYDDCEATVRRLEQLVEAGELPPFRPRVLVLTRSGDARCDGGSGSPSAASGETILMRVRS